MGLNFYVILDDMYTIGNTILGEDVIISDVTLLASYTLS